MVLQVLREHKLYAKLSKCIFYQQKVHYLGYIISAEGIIVDPENLEAIRGWKMARNVMEVRSFTGISYYYRIFTKGFSNIASPIMSLQKKGVKFEWTSKCEKSFQKMKDILTSAPILKIANLDEYFVVCIDACKEGLGGFLTQKYHVVCYESRKLKENERNYTTHDLELVTIIHALKMWRNYLIGRKFNLRIEHCGLKHLFEQPTLNGRETRWLEFLSEYDFEIKNIKGKENQVVYALRRRAHEMHIAANNMYKNDMKYKSITA
jgi:hypothetical protein